MCARQCFYELCLVIGVSVSNKPLVKIVSAAMNATAIRSVLFTARKQIVRCSICFSLLIILPFTATADQRLTLNIGGEYTTGDYGGTESVDEWYMPVTIRYSSDSWVYRATIPYLQVTAPSGGDLIGYDPGGVPIYSGSTQQETEAGLGDVIASVKYAGIYKNVQLGLLVDVTGKVKLGTADENKALGTGENDYTVGIDFIKRDKPYSVLFGLSHTWRGDPPDLIIRDTYSLYLGVVKDMTDKIDLGMVYAYGRSAFAGQDDLQELDLDVSYRLTPKSSVRVYAIIGLSEGSPDQGVGLSFGFTLM